MIDKNKMKAQSAIEYLMTYGWAIIIIAIVLGTLYLLGVFNPQGLAGTSCAGNIKYQCLTPVVTTSGGLYFTFGQNTGSTEYNLAFACAEATNTTTGGPLANATNPWEYANQTGGLFTNLTSTGKGDQLVGTQLFLQTQQTIMLDDLQCYDTNGNPIGGKFSPSPIVGAPFTAKIWVEYTNAPGAIVGTNPVVQTLAATLSTTVGTVSLKSAKSKI